MAFCAGHQHRPTSRVIWPVRATSTALTSWWVLILFLSCQIRHRNLLFPPRNCWPLFYCVRHSEKLDLPILLSIHDDSTASFPFFSRLGGRPCLLKARQWSSRSFRITRHVIYSAAPARLHPWTHRKDFPPFLTSLPQPDLMPSVITQWPFWKHFDVYTFVWLTQQSLSSIIPVGGIQPANPVVYGSCWQPGVRPPALWKRLHQLCLIRECS